MKKIIAMLFVAWGLWYANEDTKPKLEAVDPWASVATVTPVDHSVDIADLQKQIDELKAKITLPGPPTPFPIVCEPDDNAAAKSAEPPPGLVRTVEPVVDVPKASVQSSGSCSDGSCGSGGLRPFGGFFRRR